MTGPLSMLVPAAREGDQHAWDTIVDRFAPLVDAIIRGHRLSEADGDDVSQTVWLRLVEHLGDLREPDALPGWIRTTTRHECLRLLAARGRVRPVDPQDDAGLDAVAEDTTDTGLLDAERAQLLREALAELPEARRALLLLLLADPPVAYDEISRLLGMPIGSIGPTRARALDQLRRTRALRGLGPDLVGRRG
ncbi:RNA polymerase sigma factor [Pimelobacter simplex]|uniref:Putative RNA polymerase sigma factor n=1 Tax=Nocardioides simplex TaxID=2045 RepID=A0A0A1DQE7_NOCSI|nr:sigma-70 family RNA polymerase sigma factor [Pimelobacter simplex]AIY19641.2 putative RNA polymerase sigma factor [Pimelobacter simplex]GEB16796.1 RNA polymerase sigma factor [Pimelobacter simplex]SFM88389.1 RNA polymerase sigma factor, sigma-70 family [Pimelobacter simplex]